MITGEDDFRSGIGAFIHRRLWRENVGRRTYIGMAIDELKKLGDRYFRFREQVFTPPNDYLLLIFARPLHKVSSLHIQCYFNLFFRKRGDESNHVVVFNPIKKTIEYLGGETFY